ncbi:hypothetical protein [Mycobacteroides abscessus]|uniref:hypothetical protein n=1 Tax=Mycobacteroides abscessus TaxID=36809 RepID=UPI000C265B2B|nr:hypothetical protein [Mycobacteroides abscessus]
MVLRLNAEQESVRVLELDGVPISAMVRESWSFDDFTRFDPPRWWVWVAPKVFTLIKPDLVAAQLGVYSRRFDVGSESAAEGLAYLIAALYQQRVGREANGPATDSVSPVDLWRVDMLIRASCGDLRGVFERLLEMGCDDVAFEKIQ